MGIEADAEKDLALANEDADKVVGGAKKKHLKANKNTAAGFVENANIESTSLAHGTPSPLGPQPDESYMDPSV